MGQALSNRIVDSDLFFPAPRRSYGKTLHQLIMISSETLDVEIPALFVTPRCTCKESVSRYPELICGTVAKKPPDPTRVQLYNRDRKHENRYNGDSRYNRYLDLHDTQTRKSCIDTQTTSLASHLIDRGKGNTFTYNVTSLSNHSSITHKSHSDELGHTRFHKLLRDAVAIKSSMPVLDRLKDQRKFCVLYFHANACDIGIIQQPLQLLADALQVSFVAVEYPGYGLLEQCRPTTVGVDICGLLAYRYIVKHLNFRPENIILNGRSIGCGPAALLASHLSRQEAPPGGLILITPYRSISGLVGDFVPLSNWVVKSQWNVSKAVVDIGVLPLCVIHGQKDDIIHWSHGKDVFKASCAPSSIKMSHFPKHATHNSLFISIDVLVPLAKFLIAASAFDDVRKSHPLFFQRNSKLTDLPRGVPSVNRANRANRSSLNSINQKQKTDKGAPEYILQYNQLNNASNKLILNNQQSQVNKTSRRVVTNKSNQGETQTETRMVPLRHSNTGINGFYDWSGINDGI